MESERRQVFFDAAIGIPTFFVHRCTANRFLLRIVERCHRTRPSRRYPGYLRVHFAEYLRALVGLLRIDGAEAVEAFGLEPVLRDIEERIRLPAERSAGGRITRAILDHAGARSPMHLSADEFNLAAEGYYRDVLRQRHVAAGCRHLGDAVRRLMARSDAAGAPLRAELIRLAGNEEPEALVRRLGAEVGAERASEGALQRLIRMAVLTLSPREDGAGTL